MKTDRLLNGRPASSGSGYATMSCVTVIISGNLQKLPEMLNRKNMVNHPRRAMVRNWPEYLKKFRETHRLSQAQLADKLMVSLRLVENWEGAVNCPPSYLKIALKAIDDQLSGKS